MDELEKNWTEGYDTDGGGYEFSRPDADSPFHGHAALLYDGDLDYLGISECVPDPHSPMIAVIPIGDAFPLRIDSKGEAWILTARGAWNESDHECSWCGPGTGGREDCDTCDTKASRPCATCIAACTRCEGDGYVVSPGGEWASYVSVETMGLQS